MSTTTRTKPVQHQPVLLQRRITVTAGSSSSSSNSKQVSAEDVTRRMICGGLAGMIAKTATNPLERIKMLSQTGEHGIIVSSSGGGGGGGGGGGQAKNSSSILSLYRNILQKEGILGLWAGNGANLVRVFPAKAVVFSSNDYYRSLLSQVSHSFSTWSSTTTTTTTPQQHQHQQPLSGPLSFLAGGFSGMTAVAVTYPLDFARGRISGKLACAAGHKTYKGILQTIVLTAKEEGMLAIYRGITPTVMGAMPYEGIKFGTVGLLEAFFPPTKHIASDDIDDNNNNQEHYHLSTPVRKMLFGGIGGVMAGLITYPNDTVRRLLQVQGSRGNTASYAGYWDCVRQTYAAHGITRFYHGLTINLIRMAPNTALQFYFYSLLKQWTENGIGR